jgi:hypothetical protein
MPKQTGLGDNFYIGGYDLSGDINSLGSITCPVAMEDNTGIDKFAVERKALRRDGAMEFTALATDTTAGQAHIVLSALPTADVVAQYFRGTTLGGPVASMVAKQVNYDGNRNDDGSLRYAVQAVANGYGLEWGQSLTAGKRTDTAATNGSSIDTGGSLAFGAQAYLQVFAFSGDDVTIKIQDSADDSTFADVTDLAFTEVTTGPVSERISISNTSTVRRYLRVATVTDVGFTSCTFAVMINKNPIAGVTF